MSSRELELERALGALIDACIREFGWLPDAPEDAPVGNDPDCELRWGDLQSANRTLSNADNQLWDHLVKLSGYHIVRPPTRDDEFVNVCNGDLRKLSELMAGVGDSTR